MNYAVSTEDGITVYTEVEVMAKNSKKHSVEDFPEPEHRLSYQDSAELITSRLCVDDDKCERRRASVGGKGKALFTYVLFLSVTSAAAIRLPSLDYLEMDTSILPHGNPAIQVFYQGGVSEEELPECAPYSVCNKIDTYDTPWLERQCRCPNEAACSMSVDSHDGHTVTDKNRQFKICEPIKKLPKCKFFRDIAWTFINFPGNTTQQVMHCACPKNSVAYVIKRQAYHTGDGVGLQYSFACSPQSRLRCARKEPCRLFTVKKRIEVDEVNTNTLCHCPSGHKCPKKHTDIGVVPGKSYTDDMIRTYSGYCL